jgi:hypothetical protein
MPKSTNFQKISSDADLEKVFEDKRITDANRKYMEDQTMIRTLTLQLNIKERQELVSICKDIHNKHGFRPTRAQAALIAKKLYWRKS